MKEMIEWQRDTELLACQVYQDIANLFEHEPLFADFVSKLSGDERGHARIMEKALALFDSEGQYPQSDLLLDEATKKRVLKPIQTCRQIVDSKNKSVEAVLNCIIEAEFSEWNDLFIYILKTCQQYSADFQKMAAVIQNHKHRIEEFLSVSNIDASALQGMPEVWEATFLVVDDDSIIRMFLEEVLSEHAKVETAEDGREALEKAKHNYYDLILSDNDMPEMDGIDFFAALAATDQELANRFILSTGNPSDQVLEFCRQNNVRFLLPKPFALHQLDEMIDMVMKNG